MFRDKKIYMIIARVVLYVTAILLIVFVGAFLSLQTRPVRDVITGIIVKTIAQNTRSVCSIQSLNGNLLSRFEIKGVELKDSTTGLLLMSADRIDVSYSIPMLLGQVLWINRLSIDGVSVNLFQAKDGTWNFEMLAPETPSASLPDKPSDPNTVLDFNIEIRRLVIKNSNVTLAQQTDTGETVRNFKGIECQAQLDIGKEISAKVKHLAVRMDNPDVDLRDLSGNIRYDFTESRLDVNEVRIQGAKSDFTINGLVRFSEHGPNEVNPDEKNPDEKNPNEKNPDYLDMDLRADIKELSLGEFGRAFPIQMPDEDIVSGTLTVSGPVSKMDCLVDLAMDNCHVASKGLVTIDESNTVGLDIAGKINGLDLSALPVLDLNSLPGNLNTDFSLVWQQIGMSDQSGLINLDLTSSVLWNYVIDQAKLSVQISGADFIFDNLHLETPYGDLAGDLLLAGILSSEKDNRIQLTADIKAFNPEMFIPEMYRKANQYAGNINGNVALTIFFPKTFTLEELTADATCRIDSSQMMNVDISSGELETVWRDEKITINRFDMETTLGTASLTGTVSVKEETCQLKAAATLLDLKRIRTLFPDLPDDTELAGSASVSADINGKWQEPVVSAKVDAEKFSFNNVSTDSLNADGHWKGDLENFSASVKCMMNNTQTNGFKIPEIDFETNMTPASIQADIEFRGGQKEKLTLSGSVSHWLEPVKEVVVDSLTLVSFDQPPLVNQAPFKLILSDERINIEPLHLDSGNASLDLKGEAGINPPADISADLVLRDFDLKRISGFWEGGDKIQGRLSTEVRLSGLLNKPVVHMAASVKDASYDKLPVVDMSVTFNYKDAQVDITGSGVRQGNKIAEINGSAAMHLALYPYAFTPRPESLLLALRLDQVDLSNLSGLLKRKDQLKGAVSSEIELSGTLDNPNIDIKLSIKDMAYDTFSVSEAAASITYSDEKALVAASAFLQGERLMDMNGSALINLSLYPYEFVPKAGGLDLKIDLDQTDISWISDIINDPEYDISGMLAATASVSGDFSAPLVQGGMQLTDGTLGLKKQNLIYEDFNADLKFVEKTITIDGLSIKGNEEGTLKLSGELTHEQFKPQTFNIRVQGDHIYIPFHTGVDARINPDITLSGNWAAPKLEGKITVTEGRVSLERFFEKKFSEIKIIEPVYDENGLLKIPDKEPEALEFVDPLAADVDVIIPGNLVFKGKDEFVEIEGHIQLKKNPHKPFVLYGSVLPVRGTYRFRGKLFQVTTGELTFAGQEDINPLLNIEAESKIKDVTIIIRLTGSFQQINLLLDSDPPMPQADIISYLVFGRGPDDLSEQESFSAEEAALNYTGQIAADELRDIIGESLGIDYLSITAGQGSSGNYQGSLTMGKYVLPKVFVTFRQGFDETATQQLDVTYEINKYFDLETQIDNEQTSAVDLIWKYEY